MSVYFFDTSVLINGWRKHYPPSVFPSLWDGIGELMDRQSVVSCRAVYDEIQDQSDELAAWAKPKRRCFHEPTEETYLELSRFMAHFPHYTAGGGSKNAADPLVIVHAKLMGAKLVTYEEWQKEPPKKKTRPPKMPNVCKELGVEWMPPWQFLEENNFKY